jgi:hypothetical protein
VEEARFARILAERFALPETQVRAAVADAPFRVKSGAEAPLAERLGVELQALGAIVAVRPAGSTPPASSDPARRARGRGRGAGVATPELSFSLSTLDGIMSGNVTVPRGGDGSGRGRGAPPAGGGSFAPPGAPGGIHPQFALTGTLGTASGPAPVLVAVSGAAPASRSPAASSQRARDPFAPPEEPGESLLELAGGAKPQEVEHEVQEDRARSVDLPAVATRGDGATAPAARPTPAAPRLTPAPGARPLAGTGPAAAPAATPQWLRQLRSVLRSREHLRLVVGFTLALAVGAPPALRYATSSKVEQRALFLQQVDAQRNPHRYPAETEQRLIEQRSNLHTRSYVVTWLVWASLTAAVAAFFFRFT